MAIGMILLPFAAEFTSNNYSRDIVNLGYLSYEQRLQMAALENKVGQNVPSDFASYFSTENDAEPHYGPTLTNGYGLALQYVSAGDLKPILNKWHTDFETKKAAIAYVNALPDNWRVALFWT